MAPNGAKVLALDSGAVRETMSLLAGQIATDGLRPSIIVAIMNGGETPAELLAKEMEGAASPFFIRVRSSRPGIGKLKPLKSFLARYLPTWALDHLRHLEHKVQTQWTPEPSTMSVETFDHEHIELFTSVVANTEIGPHSPVLLVDDAVDTGMTVTRILATAMHVGIPRNCLRVVAIVATTANAEALVDYVRYRRILCRFPWSVDMR